MASSVLFRRSRAVASMRMRGIVSGNLPMCCTSSRSSRRWLGTTAGGGGGAPGPAGPGGREPSHSASSGEPSATAVPVDDGSLLFVAETAGLHLKGELKSLSSRRLRTQSRTSHSQIYVVIHCHF